MIIRPVFLLGMTILGSQPPESDKYPGWFWYAVFIGAGVAVLVFVTAVQLKLQADNAERRAAGRDVSDRTLVQLSRFVTNAAVNRRTGDAEAQQKWQERWRNDVTRFLGENLGATYQMRFVALLSDSDVWDHPDATKRVSLLLDKQILALEEFVKELGHCRLVEEQVIQYPPPESATPESGRSRSGDQP